MSHPQEPTDRIRIGIVLTLLATMVADGFDTAAIGFVIPTLSEQWSIPPSAFTAPLVATSVAVVIGYTMSSWLVSRLGLRVVIIASTIVIALGSAATALVIPSESIPLLTGMRLLTGIGLGSVLPAAVSYATATNPARRREAISVAVTMGLGLGVLIGGLTAGRLLVASGPAAVFWLGATLPTLIAIVQIFVLRDQTAGTPASRPARATELFTGGRALLTTLLWSFAFLIFLTQYTLLSWVPTFLLEYGFTPTEAPLGTAAAGIGGIIGAVILMLTTTRFGTARILAVASAIGAVALVSTAAFAGQKGVTLFLLAAVGAGLVGMVGQASLAVSIYPAALRTAGVGWAAALGRIASIIGPAIGGLLLAMSLSATAIIAGLAIPVALAAVLAGVLAHRLRRPDSSDSAEQIRDIPARSSVGE